MKKYLVLIILIMQFVLASGQSIVDTSKLWSDLYSHYSTFTQTTEFIKFSDDTIIEGVNYKKVEKSTDPNHSVWEFHGYVRETSEKKVYYRLDASHPDKLLYDLNVQMGDSLLVYTLYNYPSAIFDSMMYHVTGKDSVLIGDTYRTQYHLSLIFPGFTQEVEQWVDSVGSLYGGMLHNETGKYGGDSYYLLCFFENSVLKYHEDTYNSCYVVTSIEQVEETPGIVSIQPNPIINTSKIRIQGKYSQSPVLIEFYDSSGRRINKFMFTRELMISRKSFSPGLYFFILISNDQKIASGRMLIF
jgi:hypothetical protein